MQEKVPKITTGKIYNRSLGHAGRLSEHTLQEIIALTTEPGLLLSQHQGSLLKDQK